MIIEILGMLAVGTYGVAIRDTQAGTVDWGDRITAEVVR
jgi:hypothetical protein